MPEKLICPPEDKSLKYFHYTDASTLLFNVSLDNLRMKQASLKLNLEAIKTRKEVFLEQMELVVPRAVLVEVIAPYYPNGKTGRPPFSLQTMLRVHFIQQ
jgi:hypothetical protein